MTEIVPIESIVTRIILLRGERVLLDRDLAELYGVETGIFNRAVKRNLERFPKDFMFQLTVEEWELLRCQNGISKSGRGGRRYLPYAFTEHGAVMAANILKSPRAVQISVFVVRAFVRMREMLIEQKDLARQLADLEERLTERLDIHETAIVEVLRQVMTVLAPPQNPPTKPKRQIGFELKEPKGRYAKKKQEKRK
jgi:phage regulator Rha-like protein